MNAARTIRWMVVGLAVLVLAPTARADWIPGDPVKMHYPQVPDPNGWDVDVIWPNVVADDWQCTETGPVSGIHLWFSIERDGAGVPPDQIIGAVESLHVSIHEDIPVSDSPTGYSMPGELLWERDITDVIVPPQPSVGDQGWADPAMNIWRRPDHIIFFQVNAVDIDKPFMQERGEIYWLDVSLNMIDGYNGPHLGWKTTDKDWNDDAVFFADDFTGAPPWKELWEYGDVGGRSLDMAFVITPEPATLALLGVGAAALVARWRKHK